MPHRLRITLRQMRGRVRATGQIERFEISIISLSSFSLAPSTGLGSTTPPPEGPPMTDRHTANQTVPQGDQPSAEREMRCPPTGRLACPLSPSVVVVVVVVVVVERLPVNKPTIC